MDRGSDDPFMLLDPDMGIVSTATIDYGSLGSLLNDDPMTRPKDAISMIEKGIPRSADRFCERLPGQLSDELQEIVEVLEAGGDV
jgi:hypothetical protein